VTGYNVYRSGASGGPFTKINSALDGNTTYTDATISTSQTYYYVTTAVDPSGNESSYSNQVQVVIP
jgi:fibronectin type 3 domain-containing protein